MTDQSEFFPQLWGNPIRDLFSALQLWSPISVSFWTLEWKIVTVKQYSIIHIRGRANLPFPARLKPQKWLYLANTFLAPPPRGVVALVSVSDDKIQITTLILRRGVLSKKTCRNRKYQTTLKVKEYWFEHYKVIYLVLPLTLCARVITTYLIISWSHQVKMGMQNILMRMKMTTTVVTLA